MAAAQTSKNNTLNIPPVDSVPQVATPAIIKGSYPNGLEDTITNQIPTVKFSELKIIEPPKGKAGEEYIDTPIKSGGLMFLLLVSIAFVAISYRKGYKYFSTFAQNLFETRKRSNMFDTFTINEGNTIFSLIVNSCITQGLLIYFIIAYLDPQTLIGKPVLWAGLTTIGAATILFLLQFTLYYILGNVFDDHHGTKAWLNGFKAMTSLLGLLLIPIIFVAVVYPTLLQIALIIGAIIFICLRIVFISKGFRIFFYNLLSTPFFILYLCAVEIVPVIICISGAIVICGLI